MYCFMAVDKARLFVLRKGKKRMLLGRRLAAGRRNETESKVDAYLAMATRNGACLLTRLQLFECTRSHKTDFKLTRLR